MLNSEKLKNILPDLPQATLEEINKLEFFESKKRYDITGKKFNRLLVLGKGPNKKIGDKNCGQWWCLCECNNIILVRHNNLTSNNTKSCGCLNNEKRQINIKKAQEESKLDLTNQYFGKLQALYPTNERKSNSVVWQCQCECGKYHKVAANELNSHKIESCGCGKFTSKGCLKIKQILQENNIKFVEEKCFEDCYFSDTGAKARFDFYINDEFLLEYDGIQHFKECDSNYFRDSLEKRQWHDQIKNEYCKKNNIPLVRIPYTELDNITLDMIMGDKYLL